MFATVTAACLVLTFGATEVKEVWKGTMQVQFEKGNGKAAKPKKKGNRKQAARDARAARGKQSGREIDVTLRITRKRNEFVGEWTEGERTLYIKGQIGKSEFSAIPTGIKEGKGNRDVLGNTEISAEIEKGVMQGVFYGDGAGRDRLGYFSLERKQSSAEDAKKRREEERAAATPDS